MEPSEPVCEQKLVADIAHFEQEAARLDNAGSVRTRAMRTVYLAIVLRRKKALFSLRSLNRGQSPLPGESH